MLALSALAFIPFLGLADLFDWDEINFAEISREMIVLGDYLRIHVNFDPFWEKPPFFFWLQVLAMKSFGVGEFAARLPNALCGLATLAVLYKIGSHLFERRFGALWGLTYLGCLFPHIYFKTGLIDPWFNFFIFSGLYFFIVFAWKRNGPEAPGFQRGQMAYLSISALLIGMGILTKGPVALLVPGLCIAVFVILRKFRLPATIPQFIYWFILCFVIMLTWYGFETLKNGPWFVREFTKYQVHLFSQPGAGHSGFPGYHFVVNLFGVFPASIIGLPALFYLKPEKDYQRSFRLWMIIFFWVVIILFSIVQSKIIHYSSLTYFPLTFLSTLTIHETIRSRYSWKNWVTVLLLIIGLLLTLLVTITPLAGLNIQEILSRFTSDLNALQSVEVDVHWYAWEIIFGLAAMIGVITFAIFTRRQNILTGYIILLLTMAFMTNGLATRFYPKILWYSQGPQVEFFKSLQGQDCYITTLGYKSYAQYFYGQMKPQENPRKQDWHWLLTGDIDKPAYFSTQRADLEKFMSMSGDIELIGTKGRFAFLKRSPE